MRSQGFEQLYLLKPPRPANNVNEHTAKYHTNSKDLSFPDIQTLLDFVTKQWKRRWVTTDIWDEAILETLLNRPFFILVSVDAPINMRCKRFQER